MVAGIIFLSLGVKAAASVKIERHKTIAEKLSEQLNSNKKTR